MSGSRRSFLITSSVGIGAAVGVAGVGGAAAGLYSNAARPLLEGVSSDAAELPIVDTHQHLWDLSQLTLGWLKGAPEVLTRNYGLAEYAAATEGLNVVQAVYMEVDVIPEHQRKEADALIAVCRSGKSPTVAAVISGRPDSDGFAEYIRSYSSAPEIRGVRQVLHAESAVRGLCLKPQFVASMKLLGELGLSFDLCMRPGELEDGVALAKQCPETRFIVDHCGNAAPAAFLPKSVRKNPPEHDADQWRRDMSAFAACPNVICKISGVIAAAPSGVPFAESLAPIVNHCLDEFGPDRVVFGGDWPVCLLGGTYRDWVFSLRQIVADRPRVEREKLWSGNARRFYRLPA